MADFIVIRLVPPTPVDPVTFAAYLDKLTLKIYDVSYAHPDAGTLGDPTPPLGQAVFNAPTQHLSVPFPGGIYLTYPAGTTIAQSYALQIAFGKVIAVDPVSVATAVIALPAGLTEYVTPDLRIVLERTGSAPVYDGSVYYDVQLLSAGAVPDPMLDYAGLAPSCYFTLPATTDPNVAQLKFPSDGTAPSFDALSAAIDKVVAKDPGIANLVALVTANGPLSATQASNIAYEIIWGAQPPLPAPPELIDQMYTNPPNSGSANDANEQSRQQFEGSLKGYYSTRDAQAVQLTKYVFAVSAAIWCELQTQAAQSAYLRFPTNPNGSSTLATISIAEVVVSGAPGALAIDVPAEYFYALTAQLPTQISPAQRLKSLSGSTVQQNLTQLTAAVDAKIITVPVAPAPDPSQAVRMLAALAVPISVTHCAVVSIQPLWTDWLAYKPADWRQYKADDELTLFWPTEVIKPAPVPAAFLALVLCALTEGYVIANSAPPVLFATDIAATLDVHATGGALIVAGPQTVGQLAQALASDWQDFFANSALPPGASRDDLLPPFTNPGGVTAFIQHVRKFFDMPTPIPNIGGGAGAAPGTLDLPADDWIGACIAAFGPLVFGTAFNAVDLANLKAAAATVFPGDPDAQAWAVQTIVTINELMICAAVPGTSPGVRFSIAEALFARGFTGTDAVLDRPFDDFQQALTGTVAYDFAAAIYANAGAPHVFPVPTATSFGPVNDGTLRNCIAPPHRSALGPVEYLHEMLEASELSSCRDPAALPATGHLTLAGVMATRRGPIGDLLATRANLMDPIPRVDLVNECLEAIASTTPAGTRGVVYDTPQDKVGDHLLCEDECCEPDAMGATRCHTPAALFAALPAFSTPATPVAENASVTPAAYEILKQQFSGCDLPYSQAIDVSRTYLRRFGSCRFEAMRTFRRCITEFVLAPESPPAGFQSQQWRYPVRIDIAIEYLGMTPEEYVGLFGGHWPAACGVGQQDQRPKQGTPLSVTALLGFDQDPVAARLWADRVIRLPLFLERLCLSYCDFLELWKSGIVTFGNIGDGQAAPGTGKFPDCEPCCLDDLGLSFPASVDAEKQLVKLVIVVRLWRKLRECCSTAYSFAHLADICHQFVLFDASDDVNPDFVRQLAAFQMLRDEFELPLANPHAPPAPGAIGADRTMLLALWVGSGASDWTWAVQELIRRIAERAHCHDREMHELPRVVKILESNLDPLSRLVGFDPTQASNTWSALPTHTLRFAEVLAKIQASNFTVSELLYLFTADTQVQGDEPFPLQYELEAADDPLGLPEDEHPDSLWHLRRQLLELSLPDDALHAWDWARIHSFLVAEAGFDEASVMALGPHFFAGMVAGGSAASPYTEALAVADTAPAMWASYTGAPLHYVNGANPALAMSIPLRDADLLRQLRHVRPLQAAERAAVNGLYWQPRAELAHFALLFPDFPQAQHRLIEEGDEAARWHYFRHQVALCHARCELIARHLTQHVAHATGRSCPDDHDAAWLILRNLYADENRAAAPWENDAGTVPPVTWTPPPIGGALAALLGLIGTGLLREYATQAQGTIWRDVCGDLVGFGHERDVFDCPVPTVIPSLDFAIGASQQAFVSVLNGMAMADVSDRWIGGAQDFHVRWTGAILIEEDGSYEFAAGTPAAQHERPHHYHDHHDEHPARWRIEMNRGQHTWLLLHHGHGEHHAHEARVHLRRGVYELRIEFERMPLAFRDDHDVTAQYTGFQLKWSTPGSPGRFHEIARTHLYRVRKDETFGQGIDALSAAASAYLGTHYTSSLRDIRRTYQRAFKALLLTHRMELSGHAGRDRKSELGYLLSQPARFAGAAFYFTGGAFMPHSAQFDFDLLPLLDNYLPPPAAQDDRVAPSLQRKQALFDWWERLWDYRRARNDVAHRGDRPLWRLFDEAAERHPAHPKYLLRHMGADARHWSLDTRFYQDQFNPIYALTSDDMCDERWVLRSWHADRLVRTMARDFAFRDITQLQPDLWVSLDPAQLVAGEAQTGNDNLRAMIEDGLLEGDPRLYLDLERLNDGLRERGRRALLSYLCGSQGIVSTPAELSELLLIDVEAGLCERASRIDDAISAVQSFVRRARLALESGWTTTPGFAAMWDSRFVSFHVWQACKRRELYKENWIEWHELEKARRIEAFEFLDAELCRATLSIAVPGGFDYWPDSRPSAHPGLPVLQRHEPSRIKMLAVPREGLDLLGTPDADARPSWLTSVTGPANPGNPNNPNNPNGGPVILRSVRPTAAAAPGAPATPVHATLPLWMQAAVRLGARFIRVAAASYPPASTGFEPRPTPAAGRDEDCAECCTECGCVHPCEMDEYYFWLVDSQQYDALTQVSHYDANLQVATPWHDDTQLPALLAWSAQSTVHLAWCRVHNGEFQPPRRSVHAIEVPPGGAAAPDLQWLGRVSDSLYLGVTNAVSAAAPAPGFRYDLAVDRAVADNNLTVPAVPPQPYPGGLIGFPYFAYHRPGARLFPWSLFTPAITVAEALRTHCRFEAALKWYVLVHDPLTTDNLWVHCNAAAPVPNPAPAPTPIGDVPRLENLAAVGADGNNTNESTEENGPCCDSTDVSCAVARDRSVLMHYVETLLAWSKATHHQHSPESAEQTRLLVDVCRRILGPMPKTVYDPGSGAPQTVADFVPLVPPLNPRLIELYEHVQDRLALVHACDSAERLRNETLRCGPAYVGNDPARHGWAVAVERCADEEEWCHPVSPYRFQFLVQKAQELAARVHELGGALLAAIEKGDAEYLAATRARQENEISVLGRKVREDQWRDADWQVQSLQKNKEADQSSRRYYAKLISDDLNPNEQQYVSQTGTALDERMASNVIEGVAELMDVIPDIFVGFPCEETQLPVGTKLAGLFKTIARVTNTLADMAGTTGALALTQAGWDRRLQEWTHQVEVLDIQIEQVELQILGAERRRDQALRELDVQERQIENSKEVLDFLRDKFTSHAAYLWLQKEGAQLHHRMYELAMHTARQAERAFNVERGHLTRRFLPSACWGNLKEGLLAGERLQLSLAQMEKEYLDGNVREHELSTDFSLRCYFPMEFLRLKLIGRCEIEIPEWMFDLGYPGHYMRRIKSVSLTIPCVVGPYTGVHCRLTLLRSETRIDPSVAPAASHCCHQCRPRGGYEACPHDPRVVRQYGASEAIATSHAQNDSGMFELNFRDERHLPFEFAGAASRWRIELPQESNWFDMDTLSDVILHMNYTAREGGHALTHAAREAAKHRLPDRGWRLFDVRFDMPDAWARLQRPLGEHGGQQRAHRELDWRVERNLFPFIPGALEIEVDAIGLLFEAPSLRERGCGSDPCSCPDHREDACHRIELAWGGPRMQAPQWRCDAEFGCLESEDWAGLYHGIVHAQAAALRPAGFGLELRLRFPVSVHEIGRTYLLCHYTVKGAEACEPCRQESPPHHERHEQRPPQPRVRSSV